MCVMLFILCVPFDRVYPHCETLFGALDVVAHCPVLCQHMFLNLLEWIYLPCSTCRDNRNTIGTYVEGVEPVKVAACAAESRVNVIDSARQTWQATRRCCPSGYAALAKVKDVVA